MDIGEKLEGTMVLDGLLQGRLPPMGDLADKLREWVTFVIRLLAVAFLLLLLVALGACVYALAFYDPAAFGPRADAGRAGAAVLLAYAGDLRSVDEAP